MGLSTYGANKVLEHVTGVATFAPPTVWVAASTTDPATSLTEPVANNYARVALAGKIAGAAAKSISSNAVISWPQASGSWGTITHFAIMDAVSGGNIIWSDVITLSKPITTNDTLSVNSGNFTISLP